MDINFEQALKDSVLQAIWAEVQAAQEAAVTDAVRNFEKILRQRLAASVMSVSNMYSMERIGPNLRIEIRIGGLDESHT